MAEKGKPSKKSVDILTRLENRLDLLEGEMEVMREQHKMVIHQTQIAFRDQTYVRVGGAIVMPRSRTFPFRTDSGLGVFGGMGTYFGTHHVLDFALQWDVYPAFNLQYRFEFHNEAPQITWGPVFGVKVKFADIKPFDNFLDRPEDVKPLFLEVGGMVGFSLSRSMLAVQILYLTNQQGILMTNIGMHFFL